jgi:response regulator RpfG family c-di-GMP phosphodiesterase
VKRLQQARFDVLISDCRMPCMDGVTLLAHARELDPRTVRMMLSAAADFGTVLAAVNRAGVFRYIPKPWSEPQLLADLRAALAFDPLRRPERRRAGTAPARSAGAGHHAGRVGPERRGADAGPPADATGRG